MLNLYRVLISVFGSARSACFLLWQGQRVDLTFSTFYARVSDQFHSGVLVTRCVQESQGFLRLNCKYVEQHSPFMRIIMGVLDKPMK